MILTPDRRLRVFISSTLDLLEERSAARSAVESLNLSSVMFEAGARPHPPRALYRAYLEQSDVFVAIYAGRYGWIAPEMDVSGLEDEFNLSAALPRLVYIQAGIDREEALDSFLDRVREAGLSYKPYTAASQLEQLLRDDLVALLTERFHATADEASGPTTAVPAPLPTPPTPLLGRDDELREIRDRLVRHAVKLLTLVGPGGIGKTRLAVEAAGELADAFPAGVCFVPLEALRDPQLVGGEIATALGVVTSDAYPADRALADFIRDRRMLLVLDNFEQVASAGPFVAHLLSACPELAVIVTSRSPLRLRGEHEFTVDPLPVPDPSLPPWAGRRDATEHLAAVQLFVAAARDVRPSFALDEQSAPAVLEICRRLDGLPLAIELAAAMTRVLTPTMILTRLEQPLTGLPGGPRDMPARHRRLSDTIAWSYDLLDEPTRELFAQLAVFRGGFTLRHAEEICEVDVDVLSGIASLVEQSLVRADVVRDEARFSMLATLRQFAWGQLDQRPARDAVVRRHSEAFLRLASGVGRAGGRHPASLDAVEAELDNVRRALEQTLADGDPVAVAHTMWESWWFWWMRGYVDEGKLWADRCLAASDIDDTARAHALGARAMLAIWSGEYELAASAFSEAADIAADTGDLRTAAYADLGIGLVTALTTSVSAGLGHIRRGTAEFEESGDEEGMTSGFAAMSWVQGITRDFDVSDEFFAEALGRAEKVGSDVDLGIIEGALAQYRMSRGEGADVYGLVGSALDHVAGPRHIGSTILTLEIIAELGLAAGLAEPSMALLGSTAAIRSAMGTRVPSHAATRLERLHEQGREQLGGAVPQPASHGATRDFADVVQQGRVLLDELRRPHQDREITYRGGLMSP